MDEVVRLHLKKPNLLAVGVVCTAAAQKARELHGCLPTSAALLAEGLAAGFGIAGLLGEKARINLQITCDGPLRGLFVDADAQGSGRGYVKNPQVNFLAAGGPFDASGALGRSGILSVLRELKEGELYRGSIALDHFDLARDLESYFRGSEQIETAILLDVVSEGAEPLGRVAGLFVQAMPEADPRALEDARALLQSAADQPVGGMGRAFELLRPLADTFQGELDILAEYPLSYACGCSAKRVLRAVLAMGRKEIEDMLETEGRAVATCAFCNTVYEITGDQLRSLLEATEASSSSSDEPN